MFAPDHMSRTYSQPEGNCPTTGTPVAIESVGFIAPAGADTRTCLTVCHDCGVEIIARRFQKYTVALHCPACADKACTGASQYEG